MSLTYIPLFVSSTDLVVMPHSFGYRAHTRDLFQKKFRKHGHLPTQTYLKVFKVGQIVDLAGDGGVHKGQYSLSKHHHASSSSPPPLPSMDRSNRTNDDTDRSFVRLID